MLLDDDPAALIRECIGNFNKDPDSNAVARIRSSLSTLEEARRYYTANDEKAAERYARQLAIATSQFDYLISSYNSMDHASEIIALDTEKFKIAKKNSDLEIEGERLEQDLLQTRGAIEECEAGLGRKGHGQGQGQGQGQGLPRSASGLESQDQVLLKLAVYRSLGIKLRTDVPGGEVRKTIIAKSHDEARMVVHNDSCSQHFCAEHTWRSL